MRSRSWRSIIVVLGVAFGLEARADVVLFDTGGPNGLMAMASRPGVGGKAEIEAADDFIAPTSYLVNSATFTGLITGASPTVGAVDVEIYRVFPKDSNTARVPNVPTRTNSPADNAFDARNSLAGTLSFTTTTLNSNFAASNSVLNGINPSPNQTTGGEGSVAGTEVRFTVNFATPFALPADHYFFVPQVQVTGGEFYWLSSPRPVVGQFAFAPDLQAWTRNANLDPDWLRVGTDIVGGTTPPTFNGSFSLSGVAAVAVPEPSPMLLSTILALGAAACGLRIRPKRA